MKTVHHWKRAACFAVSLGLLLPACRKPADSATDQLSEAGYQPSTEDWLRAVREDNVEVMKKYAASGFALDTRDANGDGALHAAAAAGAEKAAGLLLDRGQPVDLRGGAGRTPLMLAVIANNPRMTGWLLRQGADPRLKDQDGYTPLMLAVRENSTKVVGELAVHVRDTLDAALLAAALEGRAEMIDGLTKYGASVYARMEDGRTALMVAAQNNHEEAVKMLLDLGCGRFAITPEGETAADLALVEGHQQVADLILAKPVASELSLESPAAIAAEMDAYMETAIDSEEPAATTAAADLIADDADLTDDPNPAATTAAAAGVTPARPRPPVVSLEGRTLAAAEPRPTVAGAAAGAAGAAAGGIPIVMRHYRQREIPLEVRTVSADAVTFRIAGSSPREVTVRAGETVPGSSLVVVGFDRRVATSKDNQGSPGEVSVVGISDPGTGVTRELVAGLPASAHDPLALVEDARTGQRYTASPGQRFHDADGLEYRVVDVRPNQIIIEELASGTVQTLPLRGPRG
ncbi:MAG: ankyrin repeat domain-containing protein [Akkermansiaceae bacterium]|nr:ankyrin repeat domain-containing protein [Akkermansiaceae bacterium]MCF7730756.1 ankyrin repeat domain-containing protein [Akkermansiaceae bacterium]